MADDYYDIITSAYDQLLGREPEEDALTYWNDIAMQAVSAGNDPSEAIYSGIKGSQEYQNTPAFEIPKDIYQKSYSGVGDPYRQQIMDALTPMLTSKIQGYDKLIDEQTQKALASYRSELDRTLKDVIPKQIQTLGRRGILHGTEGQKILANLVKEITLASATKGYETAIEAARQKANLPSILGGIASGAGSYSSYENPQQPYEIMANLVAGLL